MFGTKIYLNNDVIFITMNSIRRIIDYEQTLGSAGAGGNLYPRRVPKDHTF